MGFLNTSKLVKVSFTQPLTLKALPGENSVGHSPVSWHRRQLFSSLTESRASAHARDPATAAPQPLWKSRLWPCAVTTSAAVSQMTPLLRQVCGRCDTICQSTREQSGAGFFTSLQPSVLRAMWIQVTVLYGAYLFSLTARAYGTYPRIYFA